MNQKQMNQKQMNQKQQLNLQNYIVDTPIEIDNYVIIDDDRDMLPTQMNNFVKTSGNFDHKDCVDAGFGLTKICANKAIEILNKNN